MTLSSRIHDLTAVIVAAFNSRVQAPATGYDVAKLNGYTGTQAQWLADFSDPGNTDYAAQFNNGLSAPPPAGAATETTAGVTQLATLAEAQTATSTLRAISPARVLSLLTGNQDFLANLTGYRRGTDAQRAALTGSQLFEGLMFSCTDTAITWKYTGAAWRTWDSWWMNQNMNVLGFAGAYSATNGWITNGNQYRYVAGQIRMRGNIVVNGAGAVNGQIAIALPATAATPYGTPPVARCDVYRQAQGQGTFVLDINPSGLWAYLGWTNGAGQGVGTSPTSPITWAQSDIIRYDFIYQPV